MPDGLTKDADALVCLLYKHYLERRDNNISKGEAKVFGGIKEICALIPKWQEDDTLETCNELARLDYLDCFYADNTIQRCFLTDKCIIYMENRFINGAKEFITYFEKVKRILLF